jgi:hypothetical protein
VPNSAGRVGDGLDVRGDGGYVVAPPSRHGSLRRYRWVGTEREGSGQQVGELPGMPGWLVALAAPGLPERTAHQPVLLRQGDATAYGAAAVEHEAREVAAAPRGQRNHRLNRAAFKLGQLVGAGLVDRVAVTDALVSAGLSAGSGERKIRSTVQRGLRAGMHHPRRVVLQGTTGEPEAC